VLGAKAGEAKDVEPPRAVDLSRPADDLWDRIRAGFAMEDLDSPLVGFASGGTRASPTTSSAW